MMRAWYSQRRTMRQAMLILDNSDSIIEAQASQHSSSTRVHLWGVLLQVQRVRMPSAAWLERACVIASSL